MLVAYKLHKTVDEIAHLSPNELCDWLGFFTLYEKRRDEAIRKDRNKNRKRY